VGEENERRVLSDQRLIDLVTRLRSLDWSWRPDEVERLVTDFGWTIMGRALENFVLNTEFGMATGDVEVNRSGQVDRIITTVSSRVSPKTAATRAFTQDAFVRVVAVATGALGEPTHRAPGAAPQVRWRGAKSTVAVQRLSTQVQVYLATNEWVDDFDWAVSRGL
jgi:hypothetical protein